MKNTVFPPVIQFQIALHFVQEIINFKWESNLTMILEVQCPRRLHHLDPIIIKILIKAREE